MTTLLAAGLLVAGCANSTDDRVPALAAEAATSTGPATTTDPTTSTPATTADPTTSTSVTEPSTTADSTTTPSATANSVVTVVAIGDSFVAWASWPQLYADAVESALDRPTQLDTSLARGGAGPRLNAIRNDERAHDRIRAADIVIIQPEPGFAATPMNDYLAGTCGGDANTDCFSAAVEDYRGYVTEYLDLVESLTTDETAIRAIITGTWGFDGFLPELREQNPGALHDLIRLVDDLMAVVESEATARAIPVIDVNTAFTGPDHRQLAPAEYLVADRLHLDDAGSAVVARLLVEAGFGSLEGELD